MKFEVREGSSNNAFIMCTDYDFNFWKEGQTVFVKNPSNLNRLFKDMCIENMVLPNSFMPVAYLDMLPAKASFEKIISYDILKKTEAEDLKEFTKVFPDFENVSLEEVWEMYNSIISQTSPFRENLPDIKVKEREDFKRTSLYDHIELHNESYIRFFSELFSTYSLLSMRPDYYDEDSLILNIFYEEFGTYPSLDKGNNFIKVYCLSWTSEY